MKRLATASLVAFVIAGALYSTSVRAETLSTEVPGLRSKESEKPVRYDKNALHRLDLRIVGKSCPVCLLGIQRRVKALPGVVKAAVMLKRPWCASVIYDAKKVQQEKIVKTIQSYQKGTGIADIQDEPVSKVPLVLIPRREAPTTDSQVTSLE